MSNLFKVYPLYDVAPILAKGLDVFDNKGRQYLDFYGGHGVISIGHSHPHYLKKVKQQIDAIGFYSNAVKNPLQECLAKKLSEFSGYSNYKLFLCNSGAEANENALKLASFSTGKKRVIAFENSFHGRTSAAVSVTDNQSIKAPINCTNPTTFLPLNKIELIRKELEKNDVCAIIIEGIQGVGGLDEGSTAFFKEVQSLCTEFDAVLILDEIQSGYGRTGQFFAHQAHGILPDIISMAKGMGNGFPIGGILISPKFKASHGLLGTTFGGNHLACAAALAVLDVLKSEDLMSKIDDLYNYVCTKAKEIHQIKKIKGRGLLLGLEFDFDISQIRKALIEQHFIFTGGSSNKKLMRMLPPLTVTKNHIDIFFKSLKEAL